MNTSQLKKEIERQSVGWVFGPDTAMDVGLHIAYSIWCTHHAALTAAGINEKEVKKNCVAHLEKIA